MPESLNKEAKQLMKYITEYHDNLYGILTDEQKEILEKFDDCQAELTDINDRETFVYPFVLVHGLLLKCFYLPLIPNIR